MQSINSNTTITMKNYELTDYDYFRFGQQYMAVQSMMAVTDEYFFVQAQDNHGRYWALGATEDGEVYITHDHTELMMPLDLNIEFRAYKSIRDLAQVFDSPQRKSFGAKFDTYYDE